MATYYIANKQDTEHYVKVFAKKQHAEEFIQSLDQKKTWAYTAERIK